MKVFFDIESTGLDPVRDEILQLSIINENEEVLFSDYIRPVRHKTWNEAEKINHISPEMVKDKQTFVKNTSENDLYTRIAVTKYWEDESGNKVIDANPGFIEIITNDKDNWIIQDSDENKEVVYFYYKKLLEPGAVTDLFVNQIKLSSNIDNTNAMRYSGLSAHLSFEAEAIQKVGAESAILSEWGLEVKIDNNDVIQYVEE